MFHFEPGGSHVKWRPLLAAAVAALASSVPLWVSSLAEDERWRLKGIRLRRWTRLLTRSLKGLVKHDSLGMGAALAFYTIFSLGPLLVAARVGRRQGACRHEQQTQRQPSQDGAHQ